MRRARRALRRALRRWRRPEQPMPRRAWRIGGLTNEEIDRLP